ncbi:MAG: twin-arginine translocase subunit TatC [Kiritimatiellae bacterium]|nr:twin-arginine translocase subunit TatC [Kiritimatiellia bacterium]
MPLRRRKTDAGSPAKRNPEQIKPFLEHLEDLRRMLLWCVVFLGMGIAVAIPLAPHVVHVLKVPLARAGYNPEEFLKILRVGSGVAIATKVALWTGLLLAIPGIVVAVARFVFPGLKRQEKKAVFFAGGACIFLFGAGVALCYFVALPVGLRVMFQIATWLGANYEFIELGDYIAFVSKLLIAFGLVFELPVVVLALGMLGIVTSDQMKRQRRIVVVLAFVLGAVLTPTTDPVNQVLIALPLIVLYELSIWIVRVKERSPAAASPTA